MERGEFIHKTMLAGAGFAGVLKISSANMSNTLNHKTSASLIGNRFVTLCIMMCSTPREVSREVNVLQEDDADQSERASARGSVNLTPDSQKGGSRCYCTLLS